MAESVNDDFPEELQDRLTSLDDAVSHVEEILRPLNEIPIHELHEDVSTMKKWG